MVRCRPVAVQGALMSDASLPEVSIVVTICDGGASLRNCLLALSRQEHIPVHEVIVPFDQQSPEAGDMAAEFPEFRFIDLGIIGENEPKNATELHEFWDVRRAAGIKAANGRLIGLLHDRGIPASDWVASMIALHSEHPAAAVGGCVDNGIDTTWHWAVHFYDLARYMAPMPTAKTDFLSVTNLCYDAKELRQFEHLYKHGFKELPVHDAILAAGKQMILSDRPRTTEFRPRVQTSELAMEWYHWGRKYARFRILEMSLAQRLLRALGSPLVPFILFFRLFEGQRRKKVHFRKFLVASPLVLMIVSMWALGEGVGYLERQK